MKIEIPERLSEQSDRESNQKKTVKIDPALIREFGAAKRFIRVAAQDKRPIDNDWQKLPYSHDDPELQGWLAKGGNYGIVGGRGLIVVDSDCEVLKKLIAEKLPPTLTVLSPGHQGHHSYYWCDLPKPLTLLDQEGKNVGNVQGLGKMVLGPNSVHPDGGIYKIVNDAAIANVTLDQLREVLKPYLAKERAKQSVDNASEERKKYTGPIIDITKLVDLEKMEKSGDEYFGVHSVHGSESGRNFWINPSLNVWFCFRHNTGGGPFSLLAVLEGIIKCEEATPGSLKGQTFRKIIEAAEKRGLIEEQKKSKKKKKGESWMFKPCAPHQQIPSECKFTEAECQSAEVCRIACKRCAET
jgi:hypothetical protein